MSIESKVLDWFISGNTGISSEAMAAAICGKVPRRKWSSNHPHDPADFNRCLMFLYAVPEARKHMEKVAAMSPVWERLVARWDEIEKCFTDEVGVNWRNGNSAPLTYKLMREVIEAKPESP